MRHFDSDLKMYARQGLRSEREWHSIGRDVAVNSTPRATAGTRPPTNLFSRDQTQPRAGREQSDTAAVAPAAS